ncbi:40S ribosomal protein S20 [Symbiodinium microadriaticum]|uniref:40S ribosomal protein S20 n=1 Tax=Symbiodinium microadriaticum TaxID=2951 RepID=A0A1Q9ELK5_SYMMI|nr:40S ribosomal protein S20 [Symbiodinium microadriaticum]
MAPEPENGLHRIRITLSSRDVSDSVTVDRVDPEVKALEKVCTDLVTGAKAKAAINDKSVAYQASRPSTNTFDRWEMRIHKRLIDLHSPSDVVKQITSISIELAPQKSPEEVTIADL